MADENIKKEFLDGINEVYSVMFTDGINDGVYLYLMYEPEEKSIYNEVKYKTYLSPVLLVAKVQITPTQEDEDVKGIKGVAVFTVPVKSLIENSIDITYSNLANIRKGVIRYKETFYAIDSIEPKTFIEDTFMTYAFKCTEDTHIKDVLVYQPPDTDDNGEPSDEGGVDDA